MIRSEVVGLRYPGAGPGSQHPVFDVPKTSVEYLGYRKGFKDSAANFSDSTRTRRVEC